MEDTISQKYYVYTLACPDGTVFYVGKVKGNRMRQHEIEAMRLNLSYPLSRKVQIIRSIWAVGGEITKSKVFTTDSETDALIYEWALINLVYASDYLINVANNSTPGRKANKSEYKESRHRRLSQVPSNSASKNFEGLRSPKGQVYRDIPFLATFCKEHHLETAYMRKLLRGEIREYKGWKRLKA